MREVTPSTTFACSRPRCFEGRGVHGPHSHFPATPLSLLQIKSGKLELLIDLDPRRRLACFQDLTRLALQADREGGEEDAAEAAVGRAWLLLRPAGESNGFPPALPPVVLPAVPQKAQKKRRTK